MGKHHLRSLKLACTLPAFISFLFTHTHSLAPYPGQKRYIPKAFLLLAHLFNLQDSFFPTIGCRNVVAFPPPSSQTPLVVSTGMADLEDVDRIAEALEGLDFALLQCTSAYPTRPQDARIGVVSRYLQRYPNNVIGE